MVDHKLKFVEHINFVKKKVSKRIGAMYRSKSLLPLKYRKMFANALMLPQFDYLDIVWMRSAQTRLDEIDIIYKRVAKIALDYDIQESSIKVYRDMKWLPLQLRRQLHMVNYIRTQLFINSVPTDLSTNLTMSQVDQGMLKNVIYTKADRKVRNNFLTLVLNFGIQLRNTFVSYHPLKNSIKNTKVSLELLLM